MAARDWTMATATVAGVRAGAGADLPMDCGGNFVWRDRDASNTVRMTLDSATGALYTQGGLNLGKVDGTDGDHFFNIYGAAANKYGRLFTAGAGTSFQFESVGMGFGIASGGYVSVATATNQNMFFDAGGWFRWRDRDIAENPDRMTLDSATGDLWVSGRITAQTMTLLALPTTNPGVAGRIWNDGGTLKVSAG